MSSEPGEELLAEEAEALALDRARPSDHQLAGGATRSTAWLWTVAGLLGLWAAVMLVLADLRLRSEPEANLGCDINPIIGCGNFVLSWQSAALGVPNALLGTISFTIITASGAVLLLGGRLPRWYWRGLMAGAGLGALATLWFAYQALIVIRGLCPYCLVVWLVMVPLFFSIMSRGLQAGHLPAPEALRRFLIMERGLITAACYAIIVIAVVVAFWRQWLVMLS